MKKILLLLLLSLASLSFGQEVNRTPSEATEVQSTSPQPCPKGDFGDYLGLSCTQREVTYYFPKDALSVYGSIDIKPTDITMRLDPKGPYTLLIGSPKFRVKSGQFIFLVIHFKVRGANNINAWVHGCSATGDGKVYGSQIVAGNPSVVATASCAAGTPDEDQNGAKYTGDFVDSAVIIYLHAGDYGTAELRSLGIHFHMGE